MATRSTPVQVGLPAHIDGSLVRLVSDGTTDWTEVWRNGGWHRDGMVGTGPRALGMILLSARAVFKALGVPVTELPE